MGFFKDDPNTAFDVGRNNKHEVEMVPDDYSFGKEKKNEVGRPVAGTPNYYVDGTDALANRGLTINLVHVPTETGVRFKAFLMAFNESYSSDWSSESVYGRGDPIHTFKQTTRNISLSWKIVAATEGEAIENLVRLQKFLQMLYPTYTEKNNAQTINQSPLVRLQMSNMIRKVATPQTHEFLSMDKTTTNLNTGLLGIIKNVNVTHNMENTDVGVFELGRRMSSGGAGGTGATSTNNIVPKAIEVQMDFSVVHEHMLGWTKSGDTWSFGGGDTNETAFPYYVANGHGWGNRSDLTAADRIAARAAWSEQTSINAQSTESEASRANNRAAYETALDKAEMHGRKIAELADSELKDEQSGVVDFTAGQAGGAATIDRAGTQE